MWIEHKDYQLTVDQNWGKQREENYEVTRALKENLHKVRKVLTEWSRKEFSNNKRVIDNLLIEFKDCLEREWTQETAKKAKEIRGQIEEVWEREEKYWF